MLRMAIAVDVGVSIDNTIRLGMHWNLYVLDLESIEEGENAIIVVEVVVNCSRIRILRYTRIIPSIAHQC